MIFKTHPDGSISVAGGEFADEVEFGVDLLGQASAALETVIRVTTREGTASYRVVGSHPWGFPTLTARLISVERGRGDG